MKRIRTISRIAVLLPVTVFLQFCITGMELRIRPVERTLIHAILAEWMLPRTVDANFEACDN